MLNLADTQRRLLIALIATFAAVLLFSWVSTYSASYQVCQDERTYPNSNEDKNDLRHEVAYFIVCEGVTVDANGDLITAVATFFMAIFTATLWWSSLQQGRLTERAIREARESNQRQLRAYLAVTAKDIFIAPLTEPLKARIVIKNIGQTPAYDVRILTGINLHTPLTERIPLQALVNPNVMNGPFSIFPKKGHAIRATSGRVITEAELADWKEGKKLLFVFGLVSYRDAFNDPQETEFCAFLGAEEFTRLDLSIPLKPNSTPLGMNFQMAEFNNRSS